MSDRPDVFYSYFLLTCASFMFTWLKGALMNFSDENLNTIKSSATEPLDQYSFNVKVRAEGDENNNFWSPSFTDVTHQIWSRLILYVMIKILMDNAQWWTRTNCNMTHLSNSARCFRNFLFRAKFFKLQATPSVVISKKRGNYEITLTSFKDLFL